MRRRSSFSLTRTLDASQPVRVTFYPLGLGTAARVYYTCSFHSLDSAVGWINDQVIGEGDFVGDGVAPSWRIEIMDITDGVPEHVYSGSGICHFLTDALVAGLLL